MGGSSSVRGDQTIYHTDNLCFDGTDRGAPMAADGQLWIGATASNRADNGGHVRLGSLTPGTGITITNGPGTITIASTASQTDLHVSKLIVSANGTSGTGANYATIGGAIAAASPGDSIFIMPGTYLENIAINKNLNIFSSNDSQGGLTVLNGSITFTGTCSVTINGFRIKSNGANLINTSGTGLQGIIFDSCELEVTTAVTGISHLNSNANTNLIFKECYASMMAGSKFFNSTAIGNLIFYFGQFSGQGTTASTASAGLVQMQSCICTYPITTSGTCSLIVQQGYDQTFTDNATMFTVGGSGANQIIGTYIDSGTATAIIVNAATTVSDCLIKSSNAAAISGSSTISYSNISFSGSSSAITTSTQTSLVNTNFTKSIIQKFVASGTYTPTTGMKYCIIEAVGGGGGGGGTGSASGGFATTGGGGGGGGYARTVATAATIGTSQTVTIGAAGTAGAAGNNAGGNGGDSSLGSICIGKGGTGGGGSSGGAIATGGAGGVAGTGDVTFSGQDGNDGPYDAANASFHTASGGNSFFGYGGSEKAIANANATGNAGKVYGGGGGSGLSWNAGGTQAGAAGAAGIVIVTEFY